MTWLALLKVVLQLANGLANIIRERNLMDVGEAKAAAKSLAAIADRLKIGDAVRTEIEAMSDADLNDALRGDT